MEDSTRFQRFTPAKVRSPKLLYRSGKREKEDQDGKRRTIDAKGRDVRISDFRTCFQPRLRDSRNPRWPPPPPPPKRAALEISFLRVKGNGIEIGFSKLCAAPPTAMLLSWERNANTALLSAQLDRKTGKKRGWYRVDLQEYTGREECIVLSFRDGLNPWISG